MNALECLSIAAVGFTALSSRAEVQSVVAPSADANVPGTGAQVPFVSSGVRYLNVYNASEFLEAMPTGGRITEIAFRIDESDREAFMATIAGLEIRMSTTPSMAPGLPLEFARAVGPNETVVFPLGSMQFSVRPSESGPNPFGLIIPLRQPFEYDPRGGNLAVDIRTLGDIDHSIAVDAATTGFQAAALYGGVRETFAFSTRPALIMDVRFTAIPEPGIKTLFLVGGLTFWLRKRSFVCHGFEH